VEKDPFQGIPFPGPCCKREKEEEGKDTKSNDVAHPPKVPLVLPQS
jgi:hypothetical protein